MSDWFNESSLMCAAEQWPQRHAQLIEIFRPERVLQQRKLWQQQQSLLQAKFLEQAASREAFDVQPLVSSHVLDIVLLSNCGMQPSEQYKQSFLDLTKLYRKRFLSIKSANRLTFRLTSPFVHRRQQRLIKRLNKDNRLMIDELRQQLDLMSSGIVIERFELAKKLEHGSLLQLLLTGAEQQLSEAQLLAELNACNYLAYMLISTTLCFALVQIARHPGVQQRCLEELRAQSEEQQLSELPYLDAVLKETLRLQPAQLWLARQLTEDYDYTHSQLGAGSLPLGAEIYMNLFALQRSSDDYGALPTKFEPTRFLAAHPVELLSFGLGPRRCPAQDYSLLLLKTLLAPLLRQFELLPNGEPLRLDLHLTLGSKNGFQLALKQREAIN
ncbi:probable cytochrome P450 316a1 isoform X2 [Drosophila busckii]|nr:probable cytochrome P450 316a1 isoform X2 [Drosophila busckii]